LLIKFYLMSIFFSYDGKYFPEGTGVITPDSRALRYGDGLFESLQIKNGEVLLADEHFARLLYGMNILQFDIPKIFSVQTFKDDILKLATKNKHLQGARVRFSVLRGSGGLYDAENHLPHFLIQTWELNIEAQLNSNGLLLEIYQDIKKNCDILSNLKHNNYLPNAMAALFAKKSKCNDVVILNVYGRVCETTIANIFLVKNNILYTPELSEGCVAGVCRQFLILSFAKHGINCLEKEISIQELLEADEVFVTNSINHIKWVKQIGDVEFGNSFTQKIYSSIFGTN
jgi:branched-chain amino acid aminotransferase